MVICERGRVVVAGQNKVEAEHFLIPRYSFIKSIFMRKLFYSILMIATVSLLTVQVKAQVFNGNLTLNTQAEVDAFNYTSVTGIIFINSLQSSITNLDGLS